MAEEIRGPETSAEIEDLRARLAEAEDTLRAISGGKADALVIDAGRGDEVHFLGGGQSIYRRFIEAVSQGAATLSGDGTILSCDACLAKTLGIPLARVLGTSLADYLSPDDGEALGAVLALSDAGPMRRKVRLTTDTGGSVPVYVSASVLHGAGSQQVSCVMFTDLEGVVSAESALRESEERYRGLVELAPVGIAVFLDGKIAFANPAARRMLGADTDEQVLGRPVEAIIHPDSLEAALSRISSMLAGEGGPYPAQVVCLRLDGTPIDVELEVTPVSFRGSAAVQAIVIDVSQRNKDARTLERVTRALRTLSACNGALVHARDEESLLQAVCDIAVAESRYWMAWVGYAERDEAKLVRPVAFAGHEEGFLSEVGFTWGADAESSPPGLAIRERAPVLLRDVDSDTRFPIGRDARISRGYRSVAALPLIDSTGDAFGALVFIAADANAFDVDELTLLEELAVDLAFGIEARRTWVRRLEAEDARRVSEAKLKKAQHYAHVGSWTWNIETDQLVWSDEMFHLFGIEQATFSGSLPEVIARAIHPDDRHKVEQSNFMVINGKKPIPLEYRVVWPDQSVHVLWAEAGELLLDEHGNPSLLSGIAQDITERKHAEDEILRLNTGLEERVQERTEELDSSNEELSETNLKLEEATRAKSDFLASMSHELRTPLNSIIGFSGIMLQGLAGELNEEQKKELGMINNSGQHLLELINQVLDLTKIESAQDRPTIRKLGVGAVAREMFDTVRPMAEAKGIDMRWTCPEGLRPILTDRLRIGQILLNLMGNAVKFTEHGYVSVAVSQDGSGVAIAVKDSGCGIAAEDLERVFDDFYQVSPHVSAKSEGTGLGLAVSRRLAESIGARIEATSEPGRGSAFTLHIPERSRERGLPVGQSRIDL